MVVTATPDVHADEVKAALSERDVVAITIYAEARSQTVEGRIAVGCVIRNRVQTPRRYGATYREVCLARWQFSCWEPKGGLANYNVVMAVAKNLLNAMPTPPMLRECQFLTDGIMNGALLDNVKHSTHYLTTRLFATKPPAWAQGLRPTLVLHDHAFFAGVR